MITLLNILTVDPANQAALLELLRANTDSVVTTLDGWISTRLIAAAPRHDGLLPAHHRARHVQLDRG
jgi:hypothetical protein